MANRFAPSPDGGTPSQNRFAAAPDAAQQLDPAHAWAQEQLRKERAAGGSYLPQIMQDLPEKIMQGATFGWGDEIRAGAMAAARGVGSPISFDERYAQEKALQEERLKGATERTGKLGTAAEIAGGIATGGALGKAGLTTVRAGQSFLPRVIGSGIEGAGYGAVTGAGTAEDGQRTDGAIRGAVTGGAMGAAVPAVASAVAPFAKAGLSRITEKIDPQGYAHALLGQAVGRSGRPGVELADDVTRARAAGQPDYTLADGLVANREDALLRGTMTQPGQGANAAARFLDNRQLGQPTRISRFTAEDFGAPRTAAQHETLLQETMRRADDINYPAAAAGAGPVDTAGAYSNISALRYPGNPRLGAQPANPPSMAPPVVEQAAAILSRARVNGNNYESVLGAKQQIGDLIGEAARAGRNNDVRVLSQINAQLDAALEAATGGPGGLYRAANDTHALYKQGVEAIDGGRAAYDVGSLAEDVVPAFNAANPMEQAAARVGFRDAVRSRFPRNPNVNSARQFLHPEMQAKVEAMALPGQSEQFLQRMQREDVMSQTRNAATQGSQTARNLAAQEDAALDPRVVADLAMAAKTGNASGLVSALSGLWNSLRTPTAGNEAVRNEVVRQLFSGNVDAPAARAAPGFLRRLLGLPDNVAPGDLQGLLAALDRNNERLGLASGVAARVLAQGPGMMVQQEQNARQAPPAPVMGGR